MKKNNEIILVEEEYAKERYFSMFCDDIEIIRDNWVESVYLKKEGLLYGFVKDVESENGLPYNSLAPFIKSFKEKGLLKPNRDFLELSDPVFEIVKLMQKRSNAGTRPVAYEINRLCGFLGATNWKNRFQFIDVLVNRSRDLFLIQSNILVSNEQINGMIESNLEDAVTISRNKKQHQKYIKESYHTDDILEQIKRGIVKTNRGFEQGIGTGLTALECKDVSEMFADKYMKEFKNKIMRTVFGREPVLT
jgi:hypothetical protein